MQPVTLPRFGNADPSGTQTGAPQSAAHTGAWSGDHHQTSDPLDFDLLAEYLLDDGNALPGTSMSGLPQFDFSVEPGMNSGVVSPEQSEDGLPIPETTNVAHAPTASMPAPAYAPPMMHVSVSHPPAPVPAPAAVQHVPVHVHHSIPGAPLPAPAMAPGVAMAPSAPAPHTMAPAPLAVAPAPMPPSGTIVTSVHGTHMLHHSRPMLAATAPPNYLQVTADTRAPGAPVPAMTVQTHVAPAPAMTVQTHVAPAPAMTVQTHVAPAPAMAQAPMVVHQHPGAASLGNKRRRTDGAVQVMAGVTAANQLTAHSRGRQKSQAQIDRRRERNRILARRTRLRKKFFFESLQKEVMDLQRENLRLKDLVKTKLDPEVSKKLLSECKALEQLPSAVAEACGDVLQGIDQKDFNLVRNVQRSQQCFIISDPSLQDNPIVYASDDFLELTGYKREEVLGRNCRFLQGTETCPQKIQEIKKAIASGEDVSVTMINYTADGTAFWNKLFIAALRDAQSNIVNFIGVVVKVSSPDPDDPEANKRLPGQEASADEDDEHGLKDDSSETGMDTSMTMN
eukprot:CAMPEP_0202455990 /NCGR_PEP_ID=MMETSP1360-20130828/13361_1 /ASSEMBLY_ACC=CAM_ASM_000848 /TAXON_ID=515479 /ORGANISM="Licmophora paradoxa, Strain CCMP2313" /LENGTH=564 /DNA_ID=CAMNT_0049075691 /DNA_START=749 /DNA_END=2443 /DNA_ORIENTATION=+